MTRMHEQKTSIDLASEIVYRFLAAAWSPPIQGRFADRISASDLKLVEEAGAFLRECFADETIPLGFGELPVEDLAMHKVLGWLRGDQHLLADEYHRVFGLISSRECPPYETEYLANDEPFFRAQHMADLAGFYRAFGLTTSPTRRERLDHVATQLEFAALLLRLLRLGHNPSCLGDDRGNVCRDARQAFVRDHLAWWAPSFSLAVRHRAESGYYHDLARTFAAFLPMERFRLQIEPPQVPAQARPTEVPTMCEGCLK